MSLLTRFHCNCSSVLIGHFPLQVIISFRIGWRRSFSSNTRCSQRTISSGQLIGPYAELRCVHSPCYGRVGLLYFKCTDFSVKEDWTTGTNSFLYTFVIPVSSAPYYPLRYHQYCFMQCADYTRGLIGRYLMFALCKGIPYSRIREIFASGMLNLGLWNPECSSRNPESH